MPLPKYPLAIHELRSAIRETPDDPDLIQHLGLIFMETASGEMALGAFEKVVELDPQRADAFEVLAILYDIAGFDEAALEACEQAMALDPENERAPEIYADLKAKVQANAQEKAAREAFENPPPETEDTAANPEATPKAAPGENA